MRITRRDATPLALLAAGPALLLAPSLVTGRVYFTNDLTHISHPWRVLTAELLQRGQAPLWNPYAYFGLPLLGNMQAAPFDPLALLFHLFPFASALSPFLLAAYWLGTFFGYLWLRRLGASPGAAAGGAALFAAGGTVACQVQFPNILSTLEWAPAVFLLGGTIFPAALAAACAFLAGYPPGWAGLVAAWLALQAAFEPRAGAGRRLVASAAAMALAVLASAIVVLPGLELARHSSRASAIGLQERLVQSMDPADLWSFVQPWITRKVESRGRPEQVERADWTTEDGTETFEFRVPAGGEHVRSAAGARYSHLLSAYLGVAGALAAALGLAVLARRRPLGAALAAAFVGLVFLACLGGSNRVSSWLWEHAPLLKQLRGPARMHFLMLAVAPALVAAGLAALGRGRPAIAAAWSAAVLVELVGTSWAFYPTLPADYYAIKGPAASFLQRSLEGARYLQLPEVELWPHVGRESDDPRFGRFRELAWRSYKEKLFGLAHLPFHLESAGGGYEPLVPEAVDALVRALRREEDQRGLGHRLAWLGCRFLLSGGPLPDHLVGRGEALIPGRLLARASLGWEAYEAPGAARARWLAETEKEVLAATVETAGPPRGIAIEARRPREDRLVAEGESAEPGRLFLVEPRYPGWRAYVNGERRDIEAALGPFSQVEVPAGRWRAWLVYEPASFRLGAWLTTAAVAWMTAIAALRLRRFGEFQ